MVIQKLREQINSCFVGKEEVVENLLVCFLAKGHVLLEDVPGVGKTTLARVLAASVDCSFGRIQFTPDTLPSDVTGVSVYDMRSGNFEYREGAIMHQLILADEINRTSPKTQAALLEAMAEGQVSVDGKKHPLPEPFMVMATQNPVEFLGTYPLPEAQLDRFMMKLSIGYLGEKEELRLGRNFLEGKTETLPANVCSGEDILKLRKEVEKIRVSDNVLEYIREIISRTRQEESFVLGASPRAMLMLIRASQAKALLSQRDYVKPDDVKALAVNVLHHRLALTSEAKLRKADVDIILKKLISATNIPME
jgi:MoxR-like ATPase